MNGRTRIPGAIWSFGPWIAYWVLAGTGRPRAAVLAALGCSLALNVLRALRRRIKTMDLFTLLFHGLNAALILGFDLAFPVYYGGMLADLTLALYAWATLATGRPFTLEFAKEDWDRAFWQDPIFLRANAIITGVWAAVFTLQAACAAGSLAMNLQGAMRLVAVAVAPRLLLVGAICFTAWFPRWYPARVAAARARSGQSAAAPLGLSGLALVEAMPHAFDPAAARDLTAIIQFRLEGQDGGAGYLAIDRGACEFKPGEAARPDLTITAPAAIWTAVSRGERSGAEAYLRGEYKAEGDLSLLLRLQGLFSGPR